MPKFTSKLRRILKWKEFHIWQDGKLMIKHWVHVGMGKEEHLDLWLTIREKNALLKLLLEDKANNK